MHYRRLGQSGLKVSEISLGAWVTFGAQIEEQTAIDLIHLAYDNGINFFDNADVYADGLAEIVMGKAFRTLPRESLVISSKVFWQTMPGPNGRGLSRKHICESINASLRRLQTDYLDIYYCHRYDPDTPLEETVYTMHQLIQQGKILYWGTSEWRASQIASAYGIARQFGLIPPRVEQPQYNMFHRRRVEIELPWVCKEMGVGLTTWSPLYSGILSGKYFDGIPEGSRASLETMAWLRDRLTPDRLEIVQQLKQIATRVGITLPQLAIAWILRRKEISSVITGASNRSQLTENIMAGDTTGSLDEEILDQIETVIKNAPEDE